jgi:hypothetical protein
VDFRGLTPSRVWEARTPDALVNDVILGPWFEPGDVIQRIESVQEGQVGTRTRIGYRLRVQNASGTFNVEQQAFLDLTDSKITWHTADSVRGGNSEYAAHAVHRSSIPARRVGRELRPVGEVQVRVGPAAAQRIGRASGPAG